MSMSRWVCAEGLLGQCSVHVHVHVHVYVCGRDVIRHLWFASAQSAWYDVLASYQRLPIYVSLVSLQLRRR